MNIFDNAVKYNERESKEITVTTFSDRKALHITIEDNGIGMTREVQKHIFEKFYRDTTQLQGRAKGTRPRLFYVKLATGSASLEDQHQEHTGEEGSVFTVSITF